MKSFLQRGDGAALVALRPPGPAGAPVMPRLRNNGCPGGGSGASPHVEVVKEGDKVVRIVLTCGCGERVEVECLYTPGA